MGMFTEHEAISFETFLTGSIAYGCPNEDSDIDLVIRCSEQIETLLRDLSDNPKGNGIRYGKLNLICCTNDHEFEGWKCGTEKLIARSKDEGRPISRDEAIEEFKFYRGQSDS